MNASAYEWYTHSTVSTAYASSILSNDSSGLLYDGNTGTGYSITATSTFGWDSVGQIDLGSSQTVSGIIINWQVSAGASTTARVYTSTNGTSYTLQGNPLNGTRFNFTAVSARYIQVIVTANLTAGQFVELTELYGYDSTGTIIGGPGAPPPPAPRRRHLPHMY
jgi:hypothetical protein